MCFLFQLIVSLLLCLLDWCMALPLNALLHPVATAALEEQASSRAPLLDYVYRVSLPGPWAQSVDRSIREFPDRVLCIYLGIFALLTRVYGGQTF